MKMWLKLFLPLLMLLVIGFCVMWKLSYDKNKVIYFNSFSKKSETDKMRGHTVAREKGTIKVKGECLQPSAQLVIPFKDKPGYYKLSLWVKINCAISCDVLLSWKTKNEEDIIMQHFATPIWISYFHDNISQCRITANKKWTYFETTNYLKKPKSGSLVLGLYFGGYSSGGAIMHVDNVKLEKVTKPYSYSNVN